MFQFAFRIVVSFLLLLAAVSKLQVAPAILRGDSLLSNQVLLCVAICIDSGVGVWVLMAPALSAWYVITGIFATLTVFASWAVFSNRECNCFGNLLPSGASLPVNIGIVITMMLSRKNWGIGQRESLLSDSSGNSASVSRQKKLSNYPILACFASLFAASVFGVVLHLALKNQKDEPNIRFLLADDWIGKSWPIDEHFDAKLNEIKTGKWLALIFRSDCEHCKELAQRIENTSKNDQESKPKIVSFVAGSSIWPVHFGKASTVAESSIRIQWSGEEPFVASPVAFLLEDGDIIAAKDGEKADELVERVLDLPKNPRGDQ